MRRSPLLFQVPLLTERVKQLEEALAKAQAALDEMDKVRRRSQMHCRSTDLESSHSQVIWLAPSSPCSASTA